MAWGIIHRIHRLFRLTVLDDVWPEMLFFTLVATAVSVISDKTQWHLGISNSLLTVLGNAVVLQTVLSFRTATAAERYYEGRALWSSLSSVCRTVARGIWMYTPNQREKDDENRFDMEILIEKKSMINLLYALAVSVKHFVRDEKGIDYEDLYPLVCWLPAYSNISPDHPYWYKLDFQPSRSGTSMSDATPMKTSPPSSIQPKDLRVEEGSSSHQRQDSKDEAPHAGDAPRPLGSSEKLPLRGDDPEIILDSVDHCSSPENLPKARLNKLKSFRLRRNVTLSGSSSSRMPYQAISSDESDVDDQVLDKSKSVSRRTHQHQLSEAETLVEIPDNKNAASSSTMREESYGSLRNSFDLEQGHGSRRNGQLKPASEAPRDSLKDVFPLWRFLAFVGRKVRRATTNDSYELDTPVKRKRNPYILVESSVPLTIYLTLSSYLCHLFTEQLLPSAVEKDLVTCMGSLQDIIAQLERISNSPLPFTYETHIRMCLWIYLLFFPFQLYDSFGYITIPVTAFATFLFVGFLEIGRELENPFDYDPNDLDLDDICKQLHSELHEITAQIHSEQMESMLYSSSNHPFAPADHRSADRLLEGQVDSIENTMLRCWIEVNEVTREWKTK